MAGTLLPPSIESERECSPFDQNGKGAGGGPDDPGYDLHETSELDPERWAATFCFASWQFFLLPNHGRAWTVSFGGYRRAGFRGFFVNRMIQKPRQQAALGTMALYWHFIDGLWLYLWVLLFVTIQR